MKLHRLLLATTVVCSASMLHTATSRDLEQFIRAFDNWRNGNAAERQNMIDFYTTLRSDTRRPQWAQMARDHAAGMGIANLDAEIAAPLPVRAPAAPLAPMPAPAPVAAPVAPAPIAPVVPPAPIIAPAAPVAPVIPAAPVAPVVPPAPIIAPAAPVAPAMPAAPTAPAIPAAPPLTPGITYVPKRPIHGVPTPPPAPSAPVVPVAPPMTVVEEVVEQEVPEAPALAPGSTYAPITSSILQTEINPRLRHVAKMIDEQLQEINRNMNDLDLKLGRTGWKIAESGRIREMEKDLASLQQDLNAGPFGATIRAQLQEKINAFKSRLEDRKAGHIPLPAPSSEEEAWLAQEGVSIPTAPELAAGTKFAPTTGAALPTEVNPQLRRISKEIKQKLKEINENMKDLDRKLGTTGWKGAESGRIREMEKDFASLQQDLNASPFNATDRAKLQEKINRFKSRFEARKAAHTPLPVSLEEEAWFAGEGEIPTAPELAAGTIFAPTTGGVLPTEVNPQLRRISKAIENQLQEINTTMNELDRKLGTTGWRQATESGRIRAIEKDLASLQQDLNANPFGAATRAQLQERINNFTERLQKRKGDATGAPEPEAPAVTQGQWDNLQSTLTLIKNSSGEVKEDLKTYFSALFNQIARATNNGLNITDENLKKLYREASTWHQFINE